jgi:polyisoprenoid-binding protein YceI
MAKKKKTDVSFKTQLTIATGVVLLLVAFGLLVGWLDARYKLDTSSPTYADVTIKGESTCLPHKGDGPHTMECAQGIKTTSGAYYGIDGVVNRNDNDNSIEVTGTLQPAAVDTTYETAGTIKVK